jgi:hypothetical protein
MNILFRLHIHQRTIYRKKLAENLFRSGSGSGRFQKSDPDPVNSGSDLQHWFKGT